MARYIRWTLIILGLLLIFLLIFFMVQYQAVRRQEALTARELHWSLLLEHHAPLPVSEGNIIRSWMTFDYINKLFGLPPGYLKTQFGISTTSSYPRLTISGYAKSESASTTMMLDEVQNAVQGYASSSASSSASSIFTSTTTSNA